VITWMRVLWVAGTLAFLAVLGVAVRESVLDGRVRSGVVVAKVYRPSHTTTDLRYSVIFKTVVPSTTHHPARWMLDVRGEDRTARWSVSREWYERAEIGQEVSRK
jgi:hypothetical protein